MQGAPVMLLYPPGLGYKAEFFGCLYGGAIAVPVDLPERASRAVSWLPPYDSVRLIGGIIQPLSDGFPVTLMAPADFHRRSARWLEEISRVRATSSGGPSFADDLCLQKMTAGERWQLDPSSLLVAFNGSEPVRAQTMERFARVFAASGFRGEAFRPCYSLAEDTLRITRGTPWPPDETRSFDVVASRRGAATRGTAYSNSRFLVSRGVTSHDSRTKDLIVIRDRKYHTQDIEVTVQQSSSVLRHGRGAAFTVADDGENRLVIVTEVIRQAGRLDVGKIAAAIRAAVAAEHCLQVHTLVLLPSGALPKTSSGKVQRRLCEALFNRGRLPELGRSVLAQMSGGDRLRLGRHALLAVRSAARRDLLREYLCRLVASTCQAEEVELGDAPLLALGTDTYAMINIQYSVETDLGVHLTLADLSQAANLTELAARLDELLAVTVPPPRHEVLPTDRSLWFIRDIEIAAGERSIMTALRIRGKLDTAFLDSAVDALETRRTASGRVGVPDEIASRQRIAGSAPRAWLREIDAGKVSDAELADRLELAAGEPFRGGPLLRVHLYRRPTLDPVLLVVAHQLIADIWSMSALVRDFELLFAKTPGNVPAPPDPTHFVRHYSWINGSRISVPPRTDLVTARGNAGR